MSLTPPSKLNPKVSWDQATKTALAKVPNTQMRDVPISSVKRALIRTGERHTL